MFFYFLFVNFITLSFSIITEVEHKIKFEEFMIKYEKSYSEEELPKRFEIFKQNHQMVVDHTSKGLSYTLGINEFADLTFEEFKNRMGLHPIERPLNLDSLDSEELDDDFVNIPDEIDWTKKNAVTPMKNQLDCGSCWAFATSGTVEGCWAIKTGQLVHLSEQQMVDCAGSFGNNGCFGGLPVYAMKYIIMEGGLCTDKDYPYTATQNFCKFDCTPLVRIKEYKEVKFRSEPDLKASVAQVPVAVAIEVNPDFQMYTGGVYDSRFCLDMVNHGVLAVGYGHDKETGMDFWKVKNSWGETWGEDGYIRMRRNVNSETGGLCGISSMASYAIC